MSATVTLNQGELRILMESLMWWGNGMVERAEGCKLAKPQQKEMEERRQTGAGLREQFRVLLEQAIEKGKTHGP